MQISAVRLSSDQKLTYFFILISLTFNCTRIMFRTPSHVEFVFNFFFFFVFFSFLNFLLTVLEWISCFYCFFFFSIWSSMNVMEIFIITISLLWKKLFHISHREIHYPKWPKGKSLKKNHTFHTHHNDVKLRQNTATNLSRDKFSLNFTCLI